MKADAMPEALRDRLGDEAAEGLMLFMEARDERMADIITSAVVQALEPRFSAIEAQLSQCVRQSAFDGRLERIDSRFEKTDDRVTAFETRVMTKLDAQFLAIDAKLSRVTHVQVGSIALFATFAAGLYLAFITGS